MTTKLQYPINFIDQLVHKSTIEDFNELVNRIKESTNINNKFLKEGKVNIIDINNIDDFYSRLESTGIEDWDIIYRFKNGFTYEKIAEIKDITSQTVVRRINKFMKQLRHPNMIKGFILGIDYSSYELRKEEFENDRIRKENFDDASLEFLNKDIHDLMCFNSREKAVLTRHNIPNINKLITYTETELLGLPYIGQRTVNHIKEVLADYGLILKK